MNDFTNIFGGTNINPADLSYKAYALGSASIHLVWPFEALDGATVTADKIDVTSTSGTASLWLPDATLVSVGEDILFNNVGALPVTIRNFIGASVLVIQPGTQWFVYLINNDSPTPGTAGTWRTTQFGAGTSAADAATLAGMGLRANFTQLDQDLVTTTNTAPITLIAADRADVFRHTGGVVDYTIDAAASLGPPPLSSNGWFVIVINAGTGILRLVPQPGELIDDAATKTLNPTDSCVLYCFGTGFATMSGTGISVPPINALIINIAGPPPANPFTLSLIQNDARIQDFVGNLTADRDVVYSGIGYWFIYNNTTGSFAVNFKASLADPGVQVPSGNFSILRSDDTSMEIAFTDTMGTVTSVAAGTGLTAVPSPIIGAGTLSISNTAVSAGDYGSDSEAMTFSVNAQGQLTAAATVPIEINIDQVEMFDSLQFNARLIDFTGSGLVVFDDSPDLTGVPTVPNPLPINSNDSTIPNTQFVTSAVQVVTVAINTYLRGYIDGLTLSTTSTVGTPTDVFSVAPGVASDSNNLVIIQLTAIFSKTSAAWSVGDGNGALDTGALVNNTWYHVFVIRDHLSDAVDVLFSTSPTAPTLPGTFTQFRRVGSLRHTTGGNWMAFRQDGDDFYRLQVLDWDFGATRAMSVGVLSVPLGVVVEPFTAVEIISAAGIEGHIQYAPATNLGLSFDAGRVFNGGATDLSSSNNVIGPPTNTSSEIGIAVPVYSGSFMRIRTYGWRDSRGRNA